MNEALLKRATEARRLLRTCGHAALATSLDGRPYVSLVAVACDSDASPLLLLSDLAQHTRNLLAERRVSLLFEATAGYADPLAGPRLTVLGCAARVDDPRLAARFVARHPASAVYADFADFHLYRIAIERGHLVAGFGRIVDLVPADILIRSNEAAALLEAEHDIVDHLNSEHGETLRLYATKLLGAPDGAWRCAGFDPEGLELQLGRKALRFAFRRPVASPGALRHLLKELAEEARARSP
jgi:putative heme iron utilization protein